MAWYEVKGNDSDTVFSTRIRFARNLSGFRFDRGLTEEDARTVIERVGKALGEQNFTYTDLESISPMKAEALVEQHLISRELATKKGPHALFQNDNQSLSVMVCEEDHIRLQCILPGLALRDAYRFACACDDKLDAALDIAFDEKLGYLTHCPTNLGTGLRASVMLFLPAIAAEGGIPSLARQLAKIGLTMRGLYGEGSDSHGSLYQISNQVTLGLSEEEILKKLEDAVATVVERERALRRAVSGEAALRRADRIHRAEGVLRYATLISSEEFFRYFTDIKLGIALGLITSIRDEALNALLVRCLPATLTLSADQAPDSSIARDRLRAELIHTVWEV